MRLATSSMTRTLALLAVATMTTALPGTLSTGSNCWEDGDEALILMEPGSQLVTVPATPNCTAVDSNAAVTFTNADVRDHQISSTQDTGVCWKQLLRPGESFTLSLVYDGTHVNRTVPSPGKDCDNAADWDVSTDTDVVLGFRCHIHQVYAGSLIVHKRSS